MKVFPLLSGIVHAGSVDFMRKSLIMISLVMGSSAAFSQNILEGVYVRNDNMLHYQDSMASCIRGRVIDSGTALPLAEVLVELNTSDGQTFGKITDADGIFEFRDLEMRNKGFTVVCSKHPDYKVQTWNFNTTGLTEPVRIRKDIELKKNRR